MICPYCKKAGQTSRLTVGPQSSTTMAFSAGSFNEQGRYERAPDLNTRTASYACSRGHRFAVISRNGEDVIRPIGDTVNVANEQAAAPSPEVPNG